MTLLCCASAGAYLGDSDADLADCHKARDSLRCEARLQALQQCRDKTGLSRQRCLQAALPAPNCAQAPRPELCQALKAARAACRTQSGGALRRCVQRQLPAQYRLQAG